MSGMKNLIALHLGAVVLLGACGPADDAAPSTPAPLTRASTAQSLLASPELSLPLLNVGGSQHAVVAASAGDITLVVWATTDAYGYDDVVGMRVRKSDGALLDASPLCIACANGHESAPAVASNGTDFLVAWSEQPNTGWGPGSPHVRSVRVSASTGTVLTPSVQLGSMGPPSWAPVVASDGTNYLVAWQGYEFHCVFPRPRQRECTYIAAVQGARVGAATGSSSGSFPLSPPSLPREGEMQVAYGGGNYLLAWTGFPQQSSNTQNVYATRVKTSANEVLDRTPFTLALGARASGVAFDGSRFLVAWNTLGGEIRASRMGVDGTVLDSGGFLVGAGRAANVLFDGTNYRVAWEQEQGYVWRIKGVRVTGEGLVASGSESVFDENPAPSSWYFGERPALAPLSPGRFLVGYTRHIASPTYVRHVKLRVVEDLPQGLACAQDAQCQSGFCVDGVCCQSACGGGAGNDCQACSVAAGGSADGVCGAVRADAAVVCRPSAVACDVAEVCDGTSLSCPADEPSVSEPDLSGDKCEDTPCDVQAYVEGLGPEQVESGFARSLVSKAQGACQSSRQGNAGATRGKLRALLNEVEAQRGKHLSESAADTLAAALGGML